MRKLIFCFLFLFAAAPAYAATAAAAPADVADMLSKAMAGSVTALTKHGIIYLGALASLQFFIINYKLLLADAGVFEVVAKIAGFLVWLSVCMLLVQTGPSFIAAVGGSFFQIPGITLPSPGDILLSTSVIVSFLAIPAAMAGQINSSVGNFMFFLCLLIALAGLIFAAKILMLQVELGFIVFLAPLSFSYLGMDALRDQGIAPFKSLIAFGYRVILVGMVGGAFAGVSTQISDSINNINMLNILTPGSSTGIGPMIQTLILGILVYLILVIVLFKADAIAAGLASGSSSMGTGDMASAVAAGVSGGMAAAAAGQAAKAGVTQMSEFMKNMGSNMSSATTTGKGGGTPIPDVPPGGLPSLSGSPSATSLDDVRKAVQAEKAQQTGDGSTQSSVNGVSGATENVGGSGANANSLVNGGGSGAARASSSTSTFSPADGAKAAAAVSGGQNARNAAAVGAAMRATGAPETMAALAENIVADGGSAQGVANACGTTPAQNAAVQAALEGAADPAWLQTGNATTPGGSGANAGIAGIGQEKVLSFSDHMKNLGGRLGDVGSQLENEKATTTVSINTHH